MYRPTGDRSALPLPMYRAYASYRARHDQAQEIRQLQADLINADRDEAPAQREPESTTSETATEREPGREPRLTQIAETNESLASSSAHVEYQHQPPPKWPRDTPQPSCFADMTVCPACNEMMKTADWVNHSRSPRHLDYVNDRRAAGEDALRNPQDVLADAHDA